jgi:hypothetical protein|tara:strand:+ start:557 stop:733 length:177 start_codon:yes stop_codon:yes gene_type:complete
MTEYDVFSIYKEQEDKDRCTSIEANNGAITYRFADGTIEIWKSGWLGRLRKIKSREEQ